LSCYRSAPSFTSAVLAHNSPRVRVPNLEHPALSSWPDADFHGAVNFAMMEF
jgi:hypothetical protein